MRSVSINKDNNKISPMLLSHQEILTQSIYYLKAYLALHQDIDS